MANQFLILGLLALTCSLALASDSSPLQDFCVAKTNGQVLVNGLVCNDFFFAGPHNLGNTSNKLGFAMSPVIVAQLPGLNTFGISMVLLYDAPWGLIPPPSHPRTSEILTVLEGTLHAGYVTSNPENRLITKVLNKGDMFVFPVGLIHFQWNVGDGNVALSSQNPGIVTVANAVFGSNEPISIDVLAKAFEVDNKVVDYMQTQF